MHYLFVAAGLIVASGLMAAGILALIGALRPEIPARGLSDYGGFVTVDGLSVHLWQKGGRHRSKVPIILIHGFGASNWCWRHTIGPLSGRRWVLAPDLPGFGLSDKPEGFDYTLGGYARFIVSFMDTMGIAHAVLVGNSMGGGVAVAAALSVPDRVSQLILIDSLGYYRRRFMFYRLLALPIVPHLVMATAGRRSIRRLLKARVYHDPSALDDETPRRFAAAYRTQNGRKAPIWVFRGLWPYPMIERGRIESVKTPTLIIWGQNDKILPAAHARRFGTDITGAHTVVIPDTGHVPHEERPGIVNRLIVSFIDDTRRLPDERSATGSPVAF